MSAPSPSEPEPLEPSEPLDLIAEALTRAKADSISRDPSKVAPHPRVRSKPVDPVERRGPAAVSGLLREWIDDRGADVSVAVARITSCWDEVVGAAIADHCRVDKLESGVLHVVAESTAWATNLRLMSPQILARIRDEVASIVDGQAAAELVTEVRITGPRAPSWKRGRLAVQGRGPRDTYG